VRDALVDDYLQTSNPHVFAAGDVTTAPQFVYIAAHQGALAAENALTVPPRRLDLTALPRVTFTAPQIAAVGLTEQAATGAGHRVKTTVLPLSAVAPPVVNHDTRGLVKMVADADTDRLLGVHLDGIFRAETDPAVSWLGLPLLRLLARGEPVSVDELAATTGRPPELIRRALAGHADIEYDDEGRIVGNGLTLRRTHHRFEVDGRRLYTWCALDTLVYPSMLGRPARVESPCHATGVPIRLVVEPDRVAQVEPDTAVVSLVPTGDRSAIRSSFCDQVHFFASAEAATGWLDQHPGGSVVPVADAQRLGRPIIQSLPVVGGTTSSCC
jgi:alkylmercury lyase